MRVRRQEMNAGANIFRLQRFHKCAALHAAAALINAHHQQVPRMFVRPRWVRKHGHAINVGKLLAVHHGQLLATRDQRVKPWKLAQRQHRVHVGHVLFVARLLHFGLR